MKCPECVRTGQRSTFHTDGFGLVTAAGGSQSYWDADGKRHSHEVNTTETGYWCSNRHRLTHRTRPKCPSCEYGGEDSWEASAAPGEWDELMGRFV